MDDGSSVLFWVPFGVSIIGALIGGGLTFLATWIQHNRQQKAKELEKKENIKTALEAIHAEVATLWEMCETTIGKNLLTLRDDEAFSMHYEITQDYFTFYNQNAPIIASLPEQEIQKKIIQAYAYARRLIDVLRVNNYALARHEDIALRNKLLLEAIAIESGKEKGELYWEAIRRSNDSLVQVASELKLIYQQLDAAVRDLLSLLHNKIKSLQ
jgi:hypothetical protein